MIAAVLFVASVLVPVKERVIIPDHPFSRTASFIYLASFVMHFGAQIWMTFVSGNYEKDVKHLRGIRASRLLISSLLYRNLIAGLSLYFALPRHTFGEVQRVLFPRYFTINACLPERRFLLVTQYCPFPSLERYLIQFNPTSSTQNPTFSKFSTNFA